MRARYRQHWPSWNNLKRRLNWKQINILGCCGSSKWVVDTNTGEEPLMFPEHQSPIFSEPIINRQQESCIDTRMNLATALAADRRQINVGPTDGMTLKSIVRLFEVGDDNKVCDEEVGRMCCLCTERSKGAALIPCGHTYCKECSRAMWLSQGSCPLCNRLITDILQIF